MQSITKIKQFILRYRHAWVLLYSFIYMPWFCYLEKHRFSHYYLIHSPLDDYIPFVEYFIVPYLLWFLFIAVTIAYFFFTDKKGYYQLTAFLFTGMTIFLIICTVFPNELNLRPHTFANDTVFTRLVQQLYSTDTPTNVLPSIHVYNSLGAAIAIGHSQALKKNRGIQTDCSVYHVLKAALCNGCDRSSGTYLYDLSADLCNTDKAGTEAVTAADLG